MTDKQEPVVQNNPPMSPGFNIGHGHVFPRADGIRMRCGGPAVCAVCAKDLAQKNARVVHAAPPARPAPAQEPTRCRYCDGTGDVHTLDGEWRGTCTECDGAAQEPANTPYDEGPFALTAPAQEPRNVTPQEDALLLAAIKHTAPIVFGGRLIEPQPLTTSLVVDQKRVIVYYKQEHDTAQRLSDALVKIDAIRNDIIGRQSINWSRHIYPLVEALDEAGFPGMEYEEARAMIAAAKDAP